MKVAEKCHQNLDRVLLMDGSYETLKDHAGATYASVTLDAIEVMAREPVCMDKARAPCAIFSTYLEHDGRTHKVQAERGEYIALPGDIDKGNLHTADLDAAIVTVYGDVRRIVYSTSSATPTNRKWRYIVQLAEPIPGDIYHDVQRAAFALMAENGITCDTAMARPGQVSYLPNVPQERRDGDGVPLFYDYWIRGADLFSVSGSAIEARMVETQRAQEEAHNAAQAAARARAKKRLASPPGGLPTVIGAFNESTRIEDLLAQYGYQRKGRDWQSRYQTSGSFATRIMDDGEAWVSMSDSDAFAGLGTPGQHGGCWGDAFDLFTHYEHRGDNAAAAKAAAESVRLLDGRTLAEAQQAERMARYNSAQAGTAPEPLRATLAPAAPYPVNALGDVLGKAATALQETIKAPLALCAQSVLAAASLAAQAHFDAQLPWVTKPTPLSMFFLTVGASGERKSAIDDVVLGAAKAQERADMEAYQVAKEAYESDLDAWKTAADGAKKGAGKGATKDSVKRAVESVGTRPTPPVMPLRFVTDPTVEGLFKLLVVSQPSVALFSDEGGLLIGGHALNSDNALKTMARWCKMWDGAPFDRVRGGDGSSILYGRRMCMHQLAQPDVMTTLLSDRMANGQGFLARCLVAWPDSTIGTRQTERFDRAEDRPEIQKLYARLKSLMETPPRQKSQESQKSQELEPLPLRLTSDAEQLAVAAHNEFETLMMRGAELEQLRDRASKGVENACRIAGVLTVIDHGLGAREITREHLERALVLVQWYLAEALRIRAAATIPQSVMDAELLSGWLADRGLRMFRTTPVLNGGPNPLRDKARLNDAIAELEAGGYIRANPEGVVVDGVKARRSWIVLHVV